MAVLRTDGSVSFESAEEVLQHYKTYLSKGSVMVRPDKKPAPFAMFEVTLTSPTDPRLVEKVMVQAIAFPGDDVLLQVLDFAPAVDARFKRFAEAPPPPPSAPSPTPEPSLQPPPGVPVSTATQIIRADLAARGPFRNPALPTDFLKLPLTHPATAEQLAAPSVPLVLQVLASKREPCVRVVLRWAQNREVEVYSVHGATIFSSKPVQSVVSGLVEVEGTLELSPASGPPAGCRYQVPTPAMLTTVIKELVKRYIEPDLRAGMAGRMGLSPKQGPRTPHVLRRLTLSDAQLRVAARMLDGLHALDEVLYTGIGVRSTFQLLYLLEVWGALEWVEPPPQENVLVDELKATLSRARGADHFGVLGLHLSTPPRQIERAYRRFHEMYGPGGTVTRHSPELSADLWAMVERSYKVIGTAAGRKKYRTEAFPTLRLDYSADLTYSQAALAELRGDWAQAVDLLDITLELHETPQAVEALRRVRAKQSAR